MADNCDPKDDKVVTREPKDISLVRLLPYFAQNPAPVQPDVEGGQDFVDRIRLTADRIMRTFIENLPSNYVSLTTGPQYTLQFQAAAEYLARLQVFAVEVYENTDFDFTRPEFLYQTLGILVFPDGKNGIPEIDGDVTYREFLSKMALLLLEGSTPDTVREGAGILTNSNVTIFEKFLFDYNGDISRALDEQFGFELFYETITRTTPHGPPAHYHTLKVDCEGTGVTTSVVCLEDVECPEHTHAIEDFEIQSSGSPEHQHQLVPDFPEDPFALQRNVELILKALKPAHTLYDYRHLFREAFGHYVDRVIDENNGLGGNPIDSFESGVFSDEVRFGLFSYYYDDFRKFCLGVKEVVGVSGETLSDRTLFSDPTRSFQHVRPGAALTIESGVNAGRYIVREVISLPLPEDPSVRTYSTSPTNLVGTLTVESGIFVDSSQDFSAAIHGETLTVAGGPNAGTYRLETLLGNGGGPVGEASGPAIRVRPSPSTLRLDRRLAQEASGQPYTVTVDRLGAAKPREVVGEDVSRYFLV